MPRDRRGILGGVGGIPAGRVRSSEKGRLYGLSKMLGSPVFLSLTGRLFLGLSHSAPSAYIAIQAERSSFSCILSPWALKHLLS